MIARFVVVFCLVLNIRPVIANDVLTLKTDIQNLKNLNLDTDSTGKTAENDEQKQLRISFYNTVHKAPSGDFLFHWQQHRTSLQNAHQGLYTLYQDKPLQGSRIFVRCNEVRSEQ